jgi:hypothetical protein
VLYCTVINKALNIQVRLLVTYGGAVLVLLVVVLALRSLLLLCVLSFSSGTRNEWTIVGTSTGTRLTTRHSVPARVNDCLLSLLPCHVRCVPKPSCIRLGPRSTPLLAAVGQQQEDDFRVRCNNFFSYRASVLQREKWPSRKSCDAAIGPLLCCQGGGQRLATRPAWRAESRATLPPQAAPRPPSIKCWTSPPSV